MWKILLIGGSSGTGKTVVAERLSRDLGVPLSQADDFRLFAQRATSPDLLPDLHFFVDDRTSELRDRMSAEELCDRLIRVGELVSHGLEVVVDHHVDAGPPLVIEGDGITPALADRMRFDGTSRKGLVRSVFVHEPDESILLGNMIDCGRGIRLRPPEVQIKSGRLAWLYGRWIEEQASAKGLPVVASRPLNTLIDRVKSALEIDAL